MKYGNTLQQRSIPEWQSYNVDYNEIKKVIKDRTTKTEASAIAIPGQADSFAETDFEDELFEILRDQHERVNLFVRSKGGEIKRRLDHSHRQVVQLRRKIDTCTKKRVPVRRLERLSKFEAEAMKAGNDLQSLARFAAANEQAFGKILKKYQKWTGSSRLQLRFTKEVLDHSTDFSQTEVDPLLLQYEEILEILRVPFNTSLGGQLDGMNGREDEASQANGHEDEPCHTSDAAIELLSICELGSNLDLDAGLATLPLGRDAGYATYWVHSENLVQLHILLLQHTRLRALREKAKTSPNKQTPVSSRKGSVSGQSTPAQTSESDLDLLILDNPDAFAKRRSGMTIKDIETRPGRRPEEAIASIRYGVDGDAIIDIDPSTNRKFTPFERQDHSLRAYVPKKKLLRPLLDPTCANHVLDHSDTANGNGLRGRYSPEQGFDAVSKWLADHKDIEPLIRVCAKRSRFVGFSNGKEQGVWATLDRDVFMREYTFDGLDRPDDTGNHAELFPHAILGIRWEGQKTPGLINVLDNCHLVERVPGFSIQTHAVALLCQPPAMPAPFWLQALQKDIRKLPPSKPKARKGTSTPDSSGTHPTSTSAASMVDGNPSSGFSAAPYESPTTSIPDQLEFAPLKLFKKKRPNRKQRDLSWQTSNGHDPNMARYWNEFDDGEEAPTDEPYTILVDPNASDPLSEIWSALTARTTKTTQTLRALITPKLKATKAEQQSLLSTRERSIRNPAESDDTDRPSSPSTFARPRMRSKYSTFPSFHRARDLLEPLALHRIEQREALLTRCTAGAFVASFLLLLVGAILEITRRKRYIISADIGTLVGVIASVVFAISGVGLSAARQGGGGWMSKIQVGLAFLLMCLGNGIVVLMLVGG